MKATTQSVFGIMITVLMALAFFSSVSGQISPFVNETAVKQPSEPGESDLRRSALANTRWKRGGAESLKLETSETKLTVADGAALDEFGSSIAISGDTAIVGSPDDDIGANANQGSAYIFVRSGTTWVQQAKLTASDGAAENSFGYSVAISGNTAIVGAAFDDFGATIDRGAAYVFVRSGTTWMQQAKLVASDAASENYFGWSVAVSGETAIVGSYGANIGTNSDQGAAYVFVRNGASWTQQAKLTAADGAATDYFGVSVVVSGDTAVVGSYGDDDTGGNLDVGSAYIFVRNGTSWTQQAKLIASDGGIFDYFGGSLAISGDTVLVGCSDDDIGTNLDQGSVYVFVRSGANWTQQAKLTAADGAPVDDFGVSVALRGDTAVVGSYGDDVGANEDQGSAYVFVRRGANWTQLSKLIASDGAEEEDFGYSVAIGGSTVIVGSRADDFGANANQGSAYVFNLSNPRTLFDFDGDAKADLTVFRPSNGVWYLQQSQSGFAGFSFGQAGDRIVPADYDGDGKTDIAVFRPSNGTWYIQQSQAGFRGFVFGAAGDVPMPADYDGDGQSDFAVFRPSNGVWYIQRSTAGFAGVAFGANGDVPAAADYDADGKADIAVFRPSNGVWYLQQTTAGFTGVAFGAAADKAVPADYDGDGKTDLAVFRPSNGVWYLLQSTAGFTGISFGGGADLPVPADYDGDGKADVAVFRESNGVWYLNRSTQGFTGIAFGAPGDKPAPNAFVQ